MNTIIIKVTVEEELSGIEMMALEDTIMDTLSKYYSVATSTVRICTVENV